MEGASTISEAQAKLGTSQDSSAKCPKKVFLASGRLVRFPRTNTLIHILIERTVFKHNSKREPLFSSTYD